MAFHMLTITPLLMGANLELSYPGDRETLGWLPSSSSQNAQADCSGLLSKPGPLALPTSELTEKQRV